MKIIFNYTEKILFFTLIINLINVNSIYFSIYKDKPKCIFEELYKGSVSAIKLQFFYTNII